MLDHQYGEAINTKQERNEIVGPAALIVPFVACGDLSGFDYDPDKSYPLQLAHSEEVNESYTYKDPVQPPITPQLSLLFGEKERGVIS